MVCLASDLPLAAARSPRGLVRVNDQPVSGWIELEVDNNTYREADTFSVSFALSQLIAPMTPAWFASQTTMHVEVFFGFPADPANYGAGDLTSYFYGLVDSVDFDPVGRTLRLSGRDLTSLFIDAKTTEKFPNQTASQVATLLAGRHGLTPVVTTTTTPIGRYYQIDHVRMTSNSTEWELLAWMADMEQFRVYVRGQSLYFEPQPDPSSAPSYPMIWREPQGQVGNFASSTKHMSFQRTLTVGKGVIVQVHSWNPKQKAGFTATYPANKANGIKPGLATAPAQVYVKNIANLTQEQAQQKARALYNDIIKHEMKLSAALPGDNQLDITSVIAVTGTGTVFDQSYFPQSITRRIGIDEGYTMQVSAKNHSTDTSLAA